MSSDNLNLLVIANGYLISDGSAGSTVMCGLIESALDKDWNVTYLALVSEEEVKNRTQNILFTFKKNGNKLLQQDWPYLINNVNRLKRFVSAFDHSFSRLMEEKIVPSLQQHYDKVVAFDSLAINVALNVKSNSYVAILGDPAGRKVWHSSTWTQPTIKVKALLLDISELIYYYWKIPKAWELAMFGTGHSKLWSKILFRNIIDLRPFMPNSSLVSISSKKKLNKKTVLTFGGTLSGTASSLAIKSILEDYFPALREKYGSENFEFRIVGECENNLKKYLKNKHPELVIRGLVPSFEKELACGDVFLLPMNYPVGVRTRICSALAAGCVCIVHKSVLFNMPELKNCKAVMLVSTVDDCIYYISTIPSSGHFSELGRSAKLFFQNNYAASKSTSSLL